MYSKNEINELIYIYICDFLKIMQDSVYIEFRALMSSFKVNSADDFYQRFQRTFFGWSKDDL